MRDPRLLSAEQVSAYSSIADEDHAPIGGLLRGHIAALAEQLATLRTEALKLGHESGCASNICVNCGQHFDLRHYQPPNMPMLCVYGDKELRAGDCNCAQSRIQGVKHGK